MTIFRKREGIVLEWVRIGFLHAKVSGSVMYSGSLAPLTKYLTNPVRSPKEFNSLRISSWTSLRIAEVRYLCILYEVQLLDYTLCCVGSYIEAAYVTAFKQ